MANTFKNYTSSAVGVSPVTNYTVPASTSSILLGLTLANITTAQTSVDVQAAGVYLVKGAPIPANSTLSVIDGKVVLETTDTIVVTAADSDSIDVITSVLEQS